MDRNLEGEDEGGRNGTTTLICVAQRLRATAIGEKARRIGDIELGGVGTLRRRGDLACLADGPSLSLIHI